jgi:ISXO2-like transposase domain
MGDAGRAWSIVKHTNGIELFGQTVTENAVSSHPCAEVFLRGEKFPLCGVEKGSEVFTDGWVGYEGLAAQEFIHETVNHVEEYVRGQVHTQGIDNFWSLLKRTLRGTYVAVEPFHLDRYVDEQAFRYNNRATKDNPLTDADRFALALSQVAGKRLTYAELKGKLERSET